MGKLTKEELDKSIEYLHKLNDKYDGIGQDFLHYMEGLVYSKGLKYWDYIHSESLLGLQIPRTDYPDEIIFITYHQICELYFKLIKQEIDLLTNLETKEFIKIEAWYKRIGRVNNYFKHLCNSFDIMKSGMDPREFRAFRMALLPASGFQAVAFRHIEIMSTNLINLLAKEGYDQEEVLLEELYNHIYWKSGGIDMRSGKKTLTLLEFEKKYDKELLRWLRKYRFKNISFLYSRLDEELKKDKKLIGLLRDFDLLLNVHWKLSHLMASSRHLPQDDQGTGGTNWRKFLPPKFQKIIFFETLWSEEEKKDWGKAGVLKIFKENVEKGWMKPNKFEE